MAAKILIVEDDAKIAQLIAKNLSAAGLDCKIAGDGQRGLELFRKEPPDMVVLDLMLPSIDGIEVCRRIREASRVPILMLTARRGESEVVLGLEVGADDYMIKPFGTRELTARVRALLRRTQVEPATAVTVGSLVIDPQKRDAWIGDHRLEITTLEFDLLYFMAARPGRVYSREALLEHVWGRDRFVDLRSIDSLVSRLRKKIEDDPARPRYIQTVWGAGYRFAEPS